MLELNPLYQGFDQLCLRRGLFRISPSLNSETNLRHPPPPLNDSTQHTCGWMPWYQRIDFHAYVHSQFSRRQENVELIRSFEDHGLVAVINTSSRLAVFLLSEFGASYLRQGAVEPSLRKLVPPKTFLVMIPTNSTVLSIATKVARRCKDCSGQTNSIQVVMKVGIETGATVTTAVFVSICSITPHHLDTALRPSGK